MDSPAYPHAVLVSYCVIKNGFDWTRSSLAVEKAVRNRYTDQFLPRGLGVMNRVTVYMNEAGQLDRARVDPLHYQGEYAIDNPDVARFVKLGLRRDQIGPMGESVLMNDQLTDHSHITYLLVSYAWPRRANESSGALITNPMANDPGDDPAVNLAIIEKNFPDAFTEDEHKAGLPWVLLGRDGSVQLAGRAPAAFSNSGGTQAYIEALLPGSKINGYFGTSVRNAAGKSATAQFLWLAANSPVTQLSQADLAMRKDVFLYTEVTWPATASARSTEDPLQRAGTPYFTVEDRGRRTSATWQSVTFSVPGEGELPGLLRWRVVGDASLQGDILMRLEVKSPGDASQWMPAGPERRVAYGSTTEYPWADSTGQIWKFAITPAALRVPLQ